MIYHHLLDGVPVYSEDIMCTQDGDVSAGLFGQIWRIIGKLVPSEIDHILLYAGPGGWCIESGARGMIVFETPGETWSSAPLTNERLLIDSIVGVAYPLAGRELPDEERRIRSEVVSYCLERASG
jgi:hypothetical protein